MAYRKSSRRQHGSKLKVSDVIPYWTSKQIDTNEMLVQASLQSLGIYDLGSYWRKLWPILVICTVLGALIGAGIKGPSGLVIGAVLGFVTPAGLVALVVTVMHFLVYLSAYLFVWAVILGILWLLLH
jgi:hypothetical protein